ncbi:MAG: protein kinase [Anaerolineaceae bacterium]|nr:protein kinase [Anaerolineaceae bacterium]
MALNPGQQIGPYQIIGQLGHGGMATVYKAYHPRLDRFVAIKVMHKAFTEDAGFIARFEREAQIVAKLEHSHIVPVYDFNELDGQPYLVMKFIEGQTLKRVLSEGPMPLPEIIRVMDDMADALTYAHRHGVLHRDIKPSNIVIDGKGEPFLTDFGLARVTKAGASTLSADMILGTPQYISPEQASGQAELDPRTDIYSLGVILYEMVVGRVPFNADTPYSVVHDHIYTDLPRPSVINPAVPAQVEAVLLKALAKKPADRYDTAIDMMTAFKQACAEAGLTALPDNRNQVAQQSFAKMESGGLLDDSPTVSTETPAKAVPPAPSIPSPLPPKPPIIEPPEHLSRREARAARREAKRDKIFEFKFDDQNDWKKLGDRIKENVERGASWAESLGSSIEEAAKEGARAAAYEANLPQSAVEEKRIREKIEKKYKERAGLIAHATPYLIVNGMLWMIWLFTGGLNNPGLPWPVWITFFWGIGMFSHFMSYYNKYGGGAMRREEAIQREIELERERSLMVEKPKNDVRMRLTDDGELEEVPEDEISLAQKRKR